MSFRRVFTPVALALVFLLQFVPGTAFAPHAVAAQPCNWAQFIADVTIPDGTVVAPGSTFTKTWRLENIGSCTWNTSYSAAFVSGDQLGAPATLAMPASVAPGSNVDISVNLTAPSAAGHYRGNWKLRTDTSTLFGVGSSANSIFWVDIYVSGTYTSGTTYDFMANANAAAWSSGAGALPFPGTDGDTRGFALPVSNATLENGSASSTAGLIVNPQKVAGGYIQGVYPAYTVHSGDHFQGIINCTYNASGCYVNFRLMYQIGSGPVYTFWSFNERYDGLYYTFNLDLSSLAGQSVTFILYTADVSGHGTPSSDRAEWVGARVTGSGGTPIPVPPSSACNRGYFVTDVTIPDGTVMAPGTAFTKTWEIRNIGTCTWTSSYALVYVMGNPLGASSPLYLPSSVGSGTTADFSVNMVAPSVAGHYRSYWRFQDASANQFGVGSGMITFYADIYVSSTGLTPTTTTITAHSPNPSAPSQAVSVSATVSGSGATPTGTVAISGADSNCTITLSGGSGSCNVVFNSAGSKTISAVYSGDGTNAASSTSVSHSVATVGLTASTTTITAHTPNPSIPGQAVAVTVTVGGSGGTPSGSVSITGADGNCTITLTAGSGTCNVSFNTAGSKTLTATYGGDSTYAGSSTSTGHTVSKGPSATVITAHTPNPVTAGQPVTLSVTVSGAGLTPTGTVSITGADTNCTITLSSASGTCNTVVFNTAGAKTITATYNGDANYAGSSTTASETVNPAKLNPTVKITGDVPDPSAPGQTVVVGVTVTSPGSTPTGTVAITGADTNCTITLAGGSGSCNVVFMNTGAKTLTATYSGDSNYNGGTDTESHTVTQGPSTTVIIADAPDPSIPGQSVAVSATVTGAGATPTGTVIITGADTNCTITLASGSGSCNVVFNTVGGKTLTATYSGDMNYVGSSGTAGHTVNQGPSTLTITSDTPDPSASGGTVTVHVTVSGSGATPVGTVALTGTFAPSPCNINLVGGTGSCSIVFSSTGTFTITANYSGDTNYTASSASENHVVN